MDYSKFEKSDLINGLLEYYERGLGKGEDVECGIYNCIRRTVNFLKDPDIKMKRIDNWVGWDRERDEKNKKLSFVGLGSSYNGPDICSDIHLEYTIIADDAAFDRYGCDVTTIIHMHIDLDKKTLHGVFLESSGLIDYEIAENIINKFKNKIKDLIVESVLKYLEMEVDKYKDDPRFLECINFWISERS